MWMKKMRKDFFRMYEKNYLKTDRGEKNPFYKKAGETVWM